MKLRPMSCPSPTRRGRYSSCFPAWPGRCRLPRCWPWPRRCLPRRQAPFSRMPQPAGIVNSSGQEAACDSGPAAVPRLLPPLPTGSGSRDSSARPDRSSSACREIVRSTSPKARYGSSEGMGLLILPLRTGCRPPNPYGGPPRVKVGFACEPDTPISTISSPSTKVPPFVAAISALSSQEIIPRGTFQSLRLRVN